jgi:hypothetical protein
MLVPPHITDAARRTHTAPQILKAQFHIRNTYLYTCENMTALRPMFPLSDVDRIEAKMLPFTKEWQLGRGAINSVRTVHPVVDGEVRKDMCELQVRVLLVLHANQPTLARHTPHSTPPHSQTLLHTCVREDGTARLR